VRLDGHALIPVLDAILSVMPIDDFVADAIFRSTKGPERDTLDPVHEEIIACCAKHEPDRAIVPLLGPDFYPRVKAAHTVVQTGEPRLYANVILKKGVIYP
jgi:L-fucose mutarotase